LWLVHLYLHPLFIDRNKLIRRKKAAHDPQRLLTALSPNAGYVYLRLSPVVSPLYLAALSFFYKQGDLLAFLVLDLHSVFGVKTHHPLTLSFLQRIQPPLSRKFSVKDKRRIPYQLLDLPHPLLSPL
jgi:hypothetical protein